MHRFGPQVSLRIGQPSPVEQSDWEDRCNAALQKMLPILGEALDSKAERMTPLMEQLLYSARMFRLGAASGNYGVQFLCKFCALEGLVTGGEDEFKKRTFKERSRELFGSVIDKLDDIVNELFRVRNDIAHEAKCDLFQWDAGFRSPEPLIEHLNTLALCVLAFAADYVEQCRSLSELWSHAAGYEIPSVLLQKKYPSTQQLEAWNVQFTDNKLWSNIGLHFDEMFPRDERGEEDGGRWQT